MDLHWADLIFGFPLIVLVGDFPCIVTEADLYSVTCVTVLTPANDNNISVWVFDQGDVLIDSLHAQEGVTPTITDISPLSGPVTGGTELSIVGTGFEPSAGDSFPYASVSVLLGLSPCNVTFANETLIRCITEKSPPLVVPIIVTTDSGLAVQSTSNISNLAIQQETVRSL